VKKFYSVIDTAAEPLVTRTMQHVLIHELAKQLKGKISYYTSEDPDTLGSQKMVRLMLDQLEHIDGVIFLQLRQFCYGPVMNVDLLKEMLDKNCEIHFLREKISLCNVDELDEKFTLLLVYHRIYSENKDGGFLRRLIEMQG